MATGYAVEIDHTIDAVWLRDLCQKAAAEHHTRAAFATRGTVVKQNTEKYECFSKYAKRFEHIRQQEVERIKASQGLT